MSIFTLLFCLAGIVNLSIAGYVLDEDYSPSNFFTKFDFFTAPDPTNGFVQYVDQATAQGAGLIKVNGSSVYMGVDHTNAAPNGRQSVRLTSKKVYNHGLVILDVAHMPEGCGTWPAFWMTGPDWPNSGEIDIIEGVNDQRTNSYTLHTGPGCSLSSGGGNMFTGSVATSNCDINDPNQPTNAGCSIASADSGTYGSGLNAQDGGIFATEWTSESISVYFFPRSSIPSDISSGNPNPQSWGIPQAVFQGACDIDSKFKNQQIVFDTTFCGDWAGGVWSSQGSCGAKAATCEAFVQDNPSAFADAYWDVNSLKVYQDDGSGRPSPAPPSPPHHNPQPVPEPIPTSHQSSLVIGSVLNSGAFAPAPTLAIPDAQPIHHFAPTPVAPVEKPTLIRGTIFATSDFRKAVEEPTLVRGTIFATSDFRHIVAAAPTTVVYQTVVETVYAKRTPEPEPAGHPQTLGGPALAEKKNDTESRRRHARHLLKHKRRVAGVAGLS